jgi:protein-L-isoaspartate(D-aspartate) O-methyltransferase
VLSKIAGRVYSVERIPSLARRARKILDSIGCGTVNIKVTDGTFGWEEVAPFDAIIVTAGAPMIPENYKKQLAIGGRLVIPVGSRGVQVLKRVTRTGAEAFTEENLIDCRFVPLLGKLGWNDEVS